MYPTYGSNFKPLRYKSFLGEADPEEIREQQELAALKARLESEAANVPPPPPTFTEAEMEAIRARAFEDGRAQGMRDERATVNQEAVDRDTVMIHTYGKLEQQLHQISAEQHAFLSQQRAVLTSLAMTVAQKVAGRALAGNPLIEIEGMIATALQQLGNSQPLQVFVHPAIVHYMESIYAEKAVNLPRDAARLSFHADEQLVAVDDCRVEWPNGSMRRSQAEIWAQIETILQAFDPLTAAGPAPSNE